MSELSRRLRIAPSRARRLLDETEAHLRDAADAHRDEGAGERGAEQLAVAHFGSPRDIARAANGGLGGTVALLAFRGSRFAIIGSLAILIGTAIAEALARVISTSWFFGLPASASPSATVIRHWLAVQPGEHGWREAAAAENADDTLVLRAGAAVVVLLVAVTARLILRNQYSDLPAATIARIGLTVFAVAGLLLAAGSLANAYGPFEWGRGLWLCDALAAAAAAVIYRTRLEHALTFAP